MEPLEILGIVLLAILLIPVALIIGLVIGYMALITIGCIIAPALFVLFTWPIGKFLINEEVSWQRERLLQQKSKKAAAS